MNAALTIVVIFFSPYEIAPYTTGIPEFKIPADTLKDYFTEIKG